MLELCYVRLLRQVITHTNLIYICHHLRLASLSRIALAIEAKSAASFAIVSALVLIVFSFSPLSSSFTTFSAAIAAAESELQHEIQVLLFCGAYTAFDLQDCE